MANFTGQIGNVDEQLPGFFQNNLGDDSIRGFGGHDTIYGGLGDDTLFGNGSGSLSARDNDKMYGEAGNDYLYGNEGNDTLDGGFGNDTLYGGTGNDYADGSEGSDYLYGESGNDTLVGGSIAGLLTTDRLSGGTGNDYLKSQYDGTVRMNGYGNSSSERDILEGGTLVKDTYILGNSTAVFYGDSVSNASTASIAATESYALIRNFGSLLDKVEIIRGDSSNYELAVNNVVGTSSNDTLLFTKNSDGTRGDLVAVFQDTIGLSLTSGSFLF